MGKRPLKVPMRATTVRLPLKVIEQLDFICLEERKKQGIPIFYGQIISAMIANTSPELQEYLRSNGY
jgi:hypothetical protein